LVALKAASSEAPVSSDIRVHLSSSVSVTPSLVGCDFSSSPSRQKPIVLASGSLWEGRIQLSNLKQFSTLPDFGQWLKEPGCWLGGFDLPLGLPRELVRDLGWPDTWEACIRHYCAMSRSEIRGVFAAFCDARPVGGKFAHRATDALAGSSPSMKWVNPPVAYMMHAGVPLLLDAGVELAGLHPGSLGNLNAEGQPQRVALEAYPGLLAREILGNRSYKSDDRAKQTADRLIARKDLVTALEHGRTRLGLRLKVSHAQRDALVDDARGDSLDAVLCLMQAGWAKTQQTQGAPCYGLPLDMDPLEGWIVTACES
jgi:hypothetical protein